MAGKTVKDKLAEIDAEAATEQDRKDLRADWLRSHLKNELKNGHGRDKQAKINARLAELADPLQQQAVFSLIADHCDQSTPFLCNGSCQSTPC